MKCPRNFFPGNINRSACISAIGLAIILSGGCRTSHTSVSESSNDLSRDSLRQVKTLSEKRNMDIRDSIVIQDSVFLMVRGDTVYKERYRDRRHVSYVIRTDTLRQMDTVTAWHDRWRERTLTKTEYRERPLSWWQKGLRSLGLLALSSLICMGIFRLIRNRRR